VFLEPTGFDVWLTAHLARFLGRFPLFDRGVDSCIRHGVLGGSWYAATLFILWMRSAAPGQEKTRRRILTTLLGSLLAVLLTVIAGAVISWPPPIRNPSLAGLYPPDFQGNPNVNCFPSQSTAVYVAVAAGIGSLNPVAGWVLGVGAVVLGGLPRIYVGGHYPSDVVAGLLLGLVGYAGARFVLEPKIIPRVEQWLDQSLLRRTLTELAVFGWMLQVALEFRDLLWLRNVLAYLSARFLGSLF